MLILLFENGAAHFGPESVSCRSVCESIFYKQDVTNTRACHLYWCYGRFVRRKPELPISLIASSRSRYLSPQGCQATCRETSYASLKAQFHTWRCLWGPVSQQRYFVDEMCSCECANAAPGV